jgi:hypothetical protein
MTRVKTKPSVHTPVFDEESVLKFVRSAESPTGTAPHQPPGKPDAGRLPLNLLLKAETVARLEAEAARKEKSVAQIVEKLVAKHLDKH